MLDASKCFDRICWPQFLQVGLSKGIPVSVLRALSGFYLQQRRQTGLGQFIDTHVWELNRSVLQGCCMSVL
eukprot:6149851-Amphidinium_carterae.1